MRGNACEAKTGGLAETTGKVVLPEREKSEDWYSVYVLTSHWRLTALAHACASFRFLYGSAAQRK